MNVANEKQIMHEFSLVLEISDHTEMNSYKKRMETFVPFIIILNENAVSTIFWYIYEQTIVYIYK